MRIDKLCLLKFASPDPTEDRAVKNKCAIFPTAILLAAVVFGPADASAETVGTGCLSKTSGEIYALAAYRSAPARECDPGDHSVRVALYQAATGFAKRSATLGPNDRHKDMLVIEPFVLNLRAYRDGGICYLVADQERDAFWHEIIKVPPGKFQDHIREVTTLDNEGDGSVAQTYETRHLVIMMDNSYFFLFHDVLVDNRGPDCFVSFVVEHGPSLAAFYDR
jgi:hypothetical protein